jgi:hypothetical protein
MPKRSKSDGVIYCAGEGTVFPRERFHRDPVHGTVHFVDVDEPHTTFGDPVTDFVVPGVADAADVPGLPGLPAPIEPP